MAATCFIIQESILFSEKLLYAPETDEKKKIMNLYLLFFIIVVNF